MSAQSDVVRDALLGVICQRLRGGADGYDVVAGTVEAAAITAFALAGADYAEDADRASVSRCCSDLEVAIEAHVRTWRSRKQSRGDHVSS